MNSSQAGRIINKGKNEWSVEFLPEREEEYKKNKKKRLDAGIKRRKKEEEEKKKEEKRMKEIKRREKQAEAIKYHEISKQNQRIGRAVKEEIQRLKEEEIKRKQDREDKIRQKIANKFIGAKTLMQYRCAGSKGRALEGTEWGIFIFFRDGKYHRQHESPDRVKIANKPKIVEFKDKNDAIKFCNYLLYETKIYWYTDTKYLNQSDLDSDFPTKKPPNEEQLEAAVKSFISYRDMELYSDEELREKNKKTYLQSDEEIKETNKENKIQELYRSAEKNIKENDFVSAIEKYGDILQENPQYEKAYFLRAFAKSKLNDHQGAIDDYERSLKINPSDENSLLNLGISRACINDNEGAITAYSAALDMNPSIPKALFGRALAKEHLKDFEGAKVDYEKSLVLDPNNADALINLGIARAYLNQNEDAIIAFTKALKINPSNLDVIYFCGVLKSALNELEGALEDFSRIINIDKSFKDAEQKFNALSQKLKAQKTLENPFGLDNQIGNKISEHVKNNLDKEQETFLKTNKDYSDPYRKKYDDKKKQSFKDQIKEIKSLVDIDSLKKEIKKLGDSKKVKSIKDKFSKIELFNLKNPGDWISSFNKKSSITNEDLGSLLSELDGYVGLKPIKDEIKKLVNFQRIQKERQTHGYSKQNIGHHMVFHGPPGTGKTMIARLVGKIFKSLGILSRGHFIETDRSYFIGQHIGETTIKTKKVLESALGGVLFIDEAYSLCSYQSKNDFGPEAISTILKYMEDKRDDLIVIVAGYEYEMFNFLETNAGFKSRFNSFLTFPTYSERELLEILLKLSSDQGYLINDETKKLLMNYLSQISEFRQSNFGNARSMRNLLEIAIKNQANRLMEYEERSKQDLLNLIIEDFKLDMRQMQEI